MNGVLRGNCCETCCNISKKYLSRVYQEEFFNKAHAFSEPLQQLLVNKRNSS